MRVDHLDLPDHLHLVDHLVRNLHLSEQSAARFAATTLTCNISRRERETTGYEHFELKSKLAYKVIPIIIRFIGVP